MGLPFDDEFDDFDEEEDDEDDDDDEEDEVEELGIEAGPGGTNVYEVMEDGTLRVLSVTEAAEAR